MATVSTPTRPLRFCDVCGGLDDHPRHVQVVGDAVDAVPPKEFLDALPTGAPVAAVAELIKPGLVVRHIDCCAARGCVVCAATEEVTNGVRGQKLIDTIANGALDGLEPPEITTNKELGHG